MIQKEKNQSARVCRLDSNKSTTTIMWVKINTCLYSEMSKSIEKKYAQYVNFVLFGHSKTFKRADKMNTKRIGKEESITYCFCVKVTSYHSR